MYMQALFTIKGKRKEHEKTDFDSIIPDDQVICAVLYVGHIIQFAKGQKERFGFEEVWALDCYNAYDERVQKLRVEGWKYVKDLHAGWEREKNLKSSRRLGAKL